MDAFVGSWKAGPSDYENLEEYAKDLKMPELSATYANGMESTFTKEGDSYILASLVGGVTIQKMKLLPGGEIESLQSIPGVEAKLTYKVDGEKVFVEGTYNGAPMNMVQSIEDGKYVVENRSGDSWMKVRFSKA